jgi:acetolactate synthase I/II/III large subunit
MEWLDQAEHKPSGFRTPELEQRLRDLDPAAEFVDRSTEATIDYRTLTLRLAGMLPEDRTVVVDAGRFMLAALKLPAPDPLSLVTSHAFGSIGLGMATAIGAATAHPGRRCVLLAGDGGFMMGGLTELHTAIKNGFDMTIVVYDDGSYGAEHVQFHDKGMDPALAMHEWPSFAAVAEAMGATGVVVRNVADLEAAAPAISNGGGVVLVEAKLDPQVISETTVSHHA